MPITVNVSVAFDKSTAILVTCLCRVGVSYQGGSIDGLRMEAAIPCPQCVPTS